tara:strand:+ start:9699 stop:10361 length:663 start_codon:yes stop_codon:yes gene_type:complete
MTLSRRLFCTATASGMALPLLGQRHTATPVTPPRAESGLLTGQAQPLPYSDLGTFLGKEQLRWHHDSHYAGALRGFVALDKAVVGDHGKRVAKMNSVLLHELYFENMTAKDAAPVDATKKAIAARFGSVDTWREDFLQAAKSSRGWATLARHPLNGKLYNVSTDSHDDGPAWLGVPLVVIDCYEHSYYLDFQNKKADYVDGFAAHIDWEVVERRLHACSS